ncbi:MAG: hypothetical protein HZA93_23065 [Verrucomicrobia bacterium]|nr:hypothetical protein [Verrucomicrobiota bacterium]
MKTSTRTIRRSLATACALAVALWASPAAAAQPVAATPPAGAPAESTVAELFAGEVDDVGPQYLLKVRPQPRRFELWADWELTGTDNVTLAPAHPTSSTLLSAQVGLTWRVKGTEWRGGRLQWDAGARGQVYRYGFLANANHPVNFIEIDRNNFDLGGAHTALAWQRGGWLVSTGLRGATLRSRSTGRQFYREATLDGQLVRQWSLRRDLVLAAGIDGARRWTRTDSFGLLPTSWNDRAELAAVVTLERQLGPQWRVQPSLRVQGTRYTHADRDRRDRHVYARLAIIRALGARAEARLSLGHEQRESSDVTINDYQKWDLGLGGSIRWRF